MARRRRRSRGARLAWSEDNQLDRPATPAVPPAPVVQRYENSQDIRVGDRVRYTPLPGRHGAANLNGRTGVIRRVGFNFIIDFERYGEATIGTWQNLERLR